MADHRSLRRPIEGFGSRLIKRSLAEELGGEVDVIDAREGLICTIDFPIHRA